MPDRAEGLRQAAKARHEATAARVETALEALRRHAKPVNFGELARTAGVSRSWLYRHADVREKVEQLRSAPRLRQRRQLSQRASTDSLRQQLHAYRQELARLRAENAALKEQIARQLGTARAASVTQVT